MSRPAARSTKIVCTIGPASADADTIEQLAWAGMDAARLNFSHGTHDTHMASVQGVRRAQELIGGPLAVIADLQGPKIRIGSLQAPVSLQPGGTLTLAAPGRGGPGDLEVTFDELAETVRPGNPVLINDGLIRARVVEVQGARVECRVEVGGMVTSGKGVNLPGTPISMPSVTPKDADDLAFALEQGVDYIALSFVRKVDDVLDLKERVAAAGSSARVIAKIEKGEAIECLDGIVTTADAVMVARGDLGVEIGVADVPLVQKQIIAAARDAGCTVITATQMLESMIHQPEPTRAEVSDVANAVLDGTSAVMLSGETAAGRYPLEAVSTMNRICRAVEPSLSYHDVGRARQGSVAMILAHAACDIAEDLDAAVIAVPTQEGSTARQVSRFRPRRPILAASRDPKVLQQLALDWAVVPVVIESAESLEDLWHRTVDAAEQSGLAGRGDRVVLAGGRRINEPGTTDHLVVLVVE